MSDENLGDVTIDDDLATILDSNPSGQIGLVYDPSLERMTWAVLGGGILFHHQPELEFSYVIPDGSDYFVLSDDYDNEVVLPTAEPGRLIRVICVHIPRFGSGATRVRRPDSSSMNPDDVAIHHDVSPSACATFISDGTDWWVVSIYGTVN